MELMPIIVQLVKELAKQEPIFSQICEEFDADVEDAIDSVSLEFCPLDVSAKTVNGCIYLNEHLLESEVREIIKYFAHELKHVFQQHNGLVDSNTKKEDYLDDPNEIDAFQTQIEFMDDHYTDEEIQTYIENLLDHHKIHGKERKEKIKELTKDI